MQRKRRPTCPPALHAKEEAKTASMARQLTRPRNTETRPTGERPRYCEVATEGSGNHVLQHDIHTQTCRTRLFSKKRPRCIRTVRITTRPSSLRSTSYNMKPISRVSLPPKSRQESESLLHRHSREMASRRLAQRGGLPRFCWTGINQQNTICRCVAYVIHTSHENSDHTCTN